MAEKEPFCQAILRTHFQDAELFGDVSYVTAKSARAVDVLTAGFPCQDLSVAGKRAGLEGLRSGLFWEVCRVLREFIEAGKPIKWFVLENVPGLFSSGEGRDFAIVLNALDELGYGVAWRVLNSQFFGVAQRRRRVFIVGCSGKPCPQEVLFESESGGGDSQAGREAWPDLAVPLTSGIGNTGHPGGRRMEDDYNLAYCLREDPGGIGQGHNTTFVTEPIDGSWAKGGSGKSDYPVGIVCGAIDAKSRGRGYSIDEAAGGRLIAAQLSASAGHHGHSSPRGDGSDNIIVQQAISSKWAKGSSEPAGDEHHNLTVASLSGMGSGGPDHNDGQAGRIVCGCWDNDAWHKKHGLRPGERCANLGSAPSDSNRVRSFASLPEGLDSARYRALGNAVTASVAEWIGRRIIACHENKN
jgi:DNA (cytosine-5)-methyltransferase 1